MLLFAVHGFYVCRSFEVIDAGMMGNAVWSGVRLRQVLLRMFPWLGDIDAEHLRRFHVHFKSKDGWVGLFLHTLLVVVMTHLPVSVPATHHRRRCRVCWTQLVTHCWRLA